MSERMTGISAPGHKFGIEDCGRQSRADMVAQYRRYWQSEAERAQQALAIPDDELVVTTYLGTYAQKNREVVS